MTEETSTTEDVVMHEANLSETEEGEYVSGEEAEEIERTEDHEEEGAGSTVFSRHDFHAEQWDDTALIEAWDEAVKEYQMYHSVKPPTGGTKKRKRDLTHPDTGKQEQPAPSQLHGSKSAAVTSHTENRRDVTEQSTAEQSTNDSHAKLIPGQEYKGPGHACNQYYGQDSVAEGYDQHYQYTDVITDGPESQHGKYASGIPVPPIPDDEDLANVMMSWYYAGYYSGIYAAKQKQTNL